MFRIDPGRARAYIKHLLTANTPLPADTGWHPFQTVAPNQRQALLEVWEQAGAVASEELQHNQRIGQGLLSDLPPQPTGTPFEVQFHMTETGTSRCTAERPVPAAKSGSRSRSAAWMRQPWTRPGGR